LHSWRRALKAFETRCDRIADRQRPHPDLTGAYFVPLERYVLEAMMMKPVMMLADSGLPEGHGQ